jgi:hypothetical protein
MFETATDLAMLGGSITLTGILLTVCGMFFTGLYGKSLSGTAQVTVVLGMITLGSSAFCFLASLLW